MPSSRPAASDIAAYYRSSQWLYRLFCYNNGTLGMHYGFWDPGTETRAQAIVNENDAVIALGRISTNCRVLDAGCGIGGTAIHIATKTGACVTGITLDPAQAAPARRHARQRGVSDRIDFRVMSFEKMDFPDGAFDVVYGIESVCYAHPKERFLTEAYRVLKPGGRLVISDGWAFRLPVTREESEVRRNLAWGFCLPPVVTGNAMTQKIKAAGFTDVQKILKTKETWPSVKHFGDLARRVMPVARALWLIPVPHVRALYRNAAALAAVMRSYELGLGEYAIHTAEKPVRSRT